MSVVLEKPFNKEKLCEAIHKFINYDRLKEFVIKDLFYLKQDSNISDEIKKMNASMIESIIEHCYEVMYYGCRSGLVTSLIRTKDCINFVKEYFEEISDLMDQCFDDGDEPFLRVNVRFSDHLAWFVYEKITNDFINYMENIGIFSEE